MSLSSNFPTIKPSLNLDFANTKRLDPRVTFTRSTTGTYYDGVTTAKAEENLQDYSQEFNLWTGNLCSVTANTTTAPDGTSTADTVAQTVSNGEHYLYRNAVNVFAGQVYTLSVYAKNVDQNFIQFSVSSNGLYANFDLSSGVVGSSYLVTSSSITSVGGGWYRCVATLTPAASGFFFIGFINSASAGRIASYTPASATSVYLWGAQVEQRSSVTAYTATTTQPITNYIPVLLTAAANVPRFDHNPTTDESLGLLIEAERTNLQLYSEAFGSWTIQPGGCSIQSDVAISPNGTLTADKLVQAPASAGSQQTRIYYLNAVTAGTAYTMSVYAKAGGSTKFSMIGSSSGWVGKAFEVKYDLSAGTIISQSLTDSASITAVGNGWYRCTVTATPVATNAGAIPIDVLDSSGNSSFVGDGFSGVFLWGAQLEAASFPTSYIATTSLAVTRTADLATMTGVNFSSWFNAGQGTFVTQFMMPSPTGQIRRLWDIENTNTNTYVNLMAFNGYSGSDSIMYFEGTNSGTGQFAINTGSFAANTSYRVAMAYQVNDFATSTSGGTVQTDTNGVLPQGLNALWLGSHRDANWYTGYINKFAYYPVRVTNAQLQALSS